MAILFDATKRVKRTTRRAFGAGILPRYPVYPPRVLRDMEWSARETERDDVEDYGYWAAVSETQDRIEGGRDLREHDMTRAEGSHPGLAIQRARLSGLSQPAAAELTGCPPGRSRTVSKVGGSA